MEDKKFIFFVLFAIAFLVFVSFFQGNDYSGEASKDLRGKTCSELGNGDVEVIVGGEERLYEARCVEGGFKVLTNYCDGDNRKFESYWCEFGTTCNHGECIPDTDRESSQRYGLRVT